MRWLLRATSFANFFFFSPILNLFEIQNEISNPHAKVFHDSNASSLCKPQEALCFACGECSSRRVFHKLLNITVENIECVGRIARDFDRMCGGC
jgi:hypothetical protein